MKKTIVLLVFPILTISVNAALADNAIQLPSGLAFGMPIEEATAISGYRRSTASSTWLSTIETTGFSKKELLFGNATVGGYKANVYAFFDESGLCQVCYNLEMSDSKNSENAKADVLAVSESLSKKYGSPVHLAHSQHQYSPPAFIQYKDTSLDYAQLAPQDKSTWIVRLDDGGSVYIDNYYVTWIINSSISYQHYLSYTHYDFQVDTSVETTNVVDF